MTVRGWEFSGKGKTKKLAKTAAAETALQYLNNVVNVGPSATGVSLEMHNKPGQTVHSRAEEMGEGGKVGERGEMEGEREREGEGGRGRDGERERA